MAHGDHHQPAPYTCCALVWLLTTTGLHAQSDQTRYSVHDACQPSYEQLQNHAEPASHVQVLRQERSRLSCICCLPAGSIWCLPATLLCLLHMCTFYLT